MKDLSIDNFSNASKKSSKKRNWNELKINVKTTVELPDKSITHS
jgi:hypothetical protein